MGDGTQAAKAKGGVDISKCQNDINYLISSCASCSTDVPKKAEWCDEYVDTSSNLIDCLNKAYHAKTDAAKTTLSWAARSRAAFENYAELNCALTAEFDRTENGKEVYDVLKTATFTSYVGNILSAAIAKNKPEIMATVKEALLGAIEKGPQAVGVFVDATNNDYKFTKQLFGSSVPTEDDHIPATLLLYVLAAKADTSKEGWQKPFTAEVLSLFGPKDVAKK